MYRKLTHVEHILARPDSYVGSLARETTETWVDFKRANVSVSPGLVKIFDEVLVNAIDRNSMYPKQVTSISVNVDKISGMITIDNNGPLGGLVIQKNKKELIALVEKNVKIKMTVVQKDEFEKGDRKLLNFGHTIGHAIENEHALLHGHAISIGMVYAAKISQVLQGFTDTGILIETLKKYGLPISMHFDITHAMDLMQKDKKKASKGMQYVLLNKLGNAVYETVPMKSLEKLIKLYS